ncbi:CotH kinase family protein [Dysgonomonas sp. Marseille-P4677]|uniref:CotH kinase family protein n=1 Tax=Dysgonomonas sp. Marseille-P4677 TaxID=2364790 RepID=UPI001912A284|nr:CotH kinase family protein [Dysgonomonas sp. Marseille-P4677]MBK5722615.1 CotH kinase family protein [Dysgonomonas sp. Marseille-P4677]
MKNKILSFIILVLFIVSCSDNEEKEDPQFLSLSKSELLFRAEGEIQTFSIKSNTEWKIDIEQNGWLTITPLNGKGNMNITTRVIENKAKSPRSISLTIKTTQKSETITITQEAAAPEPEGFYFPLLTINTENRKPITSKEDYINATFLLESRNEKGEIIEKLLEGETEIRGRGNSTWEMEKKPYRLKLSKSSEMLGMPKNKHWVLLANYSDKTLIRNELAFEISRRMGFTYTPRMKYVDVVLNGDNIGNYMLGEHIRIDKDRVNIAELEPTDTNISGGYLLEIDERKGEPVWFETNLGEMIFCVNRPENIPSDQKEYIKNYIQNIEDILYGINEVNTVAELPKYLDIKSFIDYLLLNEMSKNVDGNLRLSTFVYKNKDDDKLYFGPVWDYDIAFGNVDYDNCEKTYDWHARNKANWYKEFFRHPEFDQMVTNRWKELRSDKLKDLHPFIDALAEEMQISQSKNFTRWPILDKRVWPNPIITGSYQGEIDYLKSWLTQRLNWMDQELK